MAGDTVARSVSKFIYIRVGGQIRWIYPPLNKPKTLGASWLDKKDYTTMRLLLISVLIAGPLGQLLACKCSGPPTIKESFDKVGLIIHGRVVNKEVITYQETFNDVKGQEIRERLKTNNDRNLGFFESPQVYKVTIEIIETLKGAYSHKTVTIFTTTSDASCGFNFKINTDYIIYASRKGFNNSRFLSETERQQDVEKENTFWTNLCTRTKRFDQKEIEELRTLKK